jgi:hypothetical protein
MWQPTRPVVGARGLSSVGRALPLQGRSQGFESPRLHRYNCRSDTPDSDRGMDQALSLTTS